MNVKAKNRLTDILLLAMIIVPFLLAVTLKVLYKPAEEGISITGALVYLEIPMPLQPLYVTEAMVNSAAVVIALFGLCLYFTRNLKVKPESKRQVIAEWVVEKVNGLVEQNMGKKFMGFAPYIAAILGLSAFSSLSSLLGLYPPTADISVIAGWAIITFTLITHYKLQGGLLGVYQKLFRAHSLLRAPQHHRRGGDPGFNVLPSLRQRNERRGHFHPGGGRHAGPVPRAAGLAARRAGQYPLAANRSARGAFAVLRSVQRVHAGLHLRHADHAVCGNGQPGGELNTAQGKEFSLHAA